jgi:hypothetical protein
MIYFQPGGVTMMFRRLLVLPATLAVLGVLGWSAPIVQNPSFEAVQIGSPFLSSTATDVPDWTHAGTVGDALLWAIGYADGGGSVTVAGDGKQFVTMGGGFNASGNGTWSQSISGFTIGLAYNLSFMLTGECSTCGTQVVTAKATGATSTMNTFNAPIPGVNYWRSWQTFDLPFTADATTEVISFNSTTQFDVGLDNVNIAQVASGVPEPATWGLFGAGAAVLALLRRRLN